MRGYNILLKIRDNNKRDSKVREEAGILLSELNTASNDLVQKEVDLFILRVTGKIND